MKFGVNLVMDFLPLLASAVEGLGRQSMASHGTVPCVWVSRLLAQDPLHSIRPTHDVTSSPHGTASRLRAHGFLESILSNPHVKLRA